MKNPICVIAVHLTENLFPKTEQIITYIKPFLSDLNQSDLRFIAPKYMHLTLELPGRFNQDISEKDIPPMIEKLQKIAASTKSFPITLGDLSYFPGSIIRMVSDPIGHLLALHSQIAHQIEFTVRPDFRHENFSPHLSLIYLAEYPQSLFKNPEFSTQLMPDKMTVSKISLYKTYTHQQYTEVILAKLPLKG